LAKLGGLKAPLSDQQLAAKTLLKQLDLTGDGLGSKRASAACVTEPFF
jgi:hypothetical protein